MTPTEAHRRLEAHKSQPAHELCGATPPAVTRCYGCGEPAERLDDCGVCHHPTCTDCWNHTDEACQYCVDAFTELTACVVV